MTPGRRITWTPLRCPMSWRSFTTKAHRLSSLSTARRGTAAVGHSGFVNGTDEDDRRSGRIIQSKARILDAQFECVDVRLQHIRIRFRGFELTLQIEDGEHQAKQDTFGAVADFQLVGVV